MDWKLELIVIPVTDVDRAKAFYMEQVGFDLLVDHGAGQDFRVVQLVPSGSACAIAVMKQAERAGSVLGLHLIVTDIDAAGRVARAGGRGQRAVPLRKWRSGARTRSGPPRLQLLLQLRGSRRERMAGAGGHAERGPVRPVPLLSAR